MHLTPQKCTVDDSVPPKLTEAVEYYSDDLPHPIIFSIQYEVWTRKWQAYSDPSKLPSSLVDVYKDCSRIQFPNIKAECESFSQLKLLKTPSRSTMPEKRLSGLALMKIHRDYCVELSSPERIKGGRTWQPCGYYGMLPLVALAFDHGREYYYFPADM